MTKEHKYRIGQLVKYVGPVEQYKGVRLYIVTKETFETKFEFNKSDVQMYYNLFPKTLKPRELAQLQANGIGLTLVHEDDIMPVSAGWLEKLTKAVKIKIKQ